MLQAHGLCGHIRNNNWKSLLLLGGYLLIVQFMMTAVWSLLITLMVPVRTFDDFVTKIWDWQLTGALPVLAASLAWLGIALLRHKSMTSELAGLQIFTTRKSRPPDCLASTWQWARPSRISKIPNPFGAAILTKPTQQRQRKMVQGFLASVDSPNPVISPHRAIKIINV